MNALNRTGMAKKYKGKWVALRADRKTVVATGNSVKSVRKSALQKGYEQPIITRLPKTQKHFIGFQGEQ